MNEPAKCVVGHYTGPRWYSVLPAGRCNIVLSSTELNLCKNGFFFGKRYEPTDAASDASAAPPPPLAEKCEYQAEDSKDGGWDNDLICQFGAGGGALYWTQMVSRLMDLIVNSLNSNKEVFLLELIRRINYGCINLDMSTYLAVIKLLQQCLLSKEVNVRFDGSICTGITIFCAHCSDTGTVVTWQDNKDAGGDDDLIGQFGVGFYSAFLVSFRPSFLFTEFESLPCLYFFFPIFMMPKVLHIQSIFRGS
ncbi:hypothetical protein Dsin_015627 [Dipteronia sinensis]|uniref:Uncharacterized protein n=1 Tax=Dipteronia sinensis TaxID=43782 RepID=A0AAE0E4R1_9ROSI|nr:hypothetical protein Dsin_015627 [Dipteronia sinensis]